MKKILLVVMIVTLLTPLKIPMAYEEPDDSGESENEESFPYPKLDDLMKELKDKFNTAIILITHDLGVVADLCTRIYVMYGGIIVEEGTDEDIFYRGKHPYTIGLLKSVPNPKSLVKEKLIPIEGQPPDLFKPPVGCPFAARCKYAMKICTQKMPPSFKEGEGHNVSCWLCHENAPKVNLEK